MLACGCYVEASMSVSLDQAMNGTADARAAFISIHGSNCDHPTVRKKLERLVWDTFTGAQFEACEHGSKARFSMPLLYIRDAGTSPAPDYLAIESFDNRLVGFRIPAKLARKLEALGKRADDPRIDVTLDVTNDTGKPLPVRMRSVYINGTPMLGGDGVLAPGDGLRVRLSDVLLDAIRQQGRFEVISLSSEIRGE